MGIVRRADGEPRRKRFAGIALTVAAVLAGVGGATAYWTSTGSGSVNGASATPQALTVLVTSTLSSLAPGLGTALSGDFTNPNPYPVYVNSVTATIGSFSSQANGLLPACTGSDFSITGTVTVNAEIPPGSNKGSWSGLTITLNDSGLNQNNCIGLSSIPITLTSN